MGGGGGGRRSCVCVCVGGWGWGGLLANQGGHSLAKPPLGPVQTAIAQPTCPLMPANILAACFFTVPMSDAIHPPSCPCRHVQQHAAAGCPSAGPPRGGGAARPPAAPHPGGGAGSSGAPV
jgi:hypothetical protein